MKLRASVSRTADGRLKHLQMKVVDVGQGVFKMLGIALPSFKQLKALHLGEGRYLSKAGSRLVRGHAF